MKFHNTRIVLLFFASYVVLGVTTARAANPFESASRLINQLAARHSTDVTVSLLKTDPVAGKRASGLLNIRDFYVSFGTDGTLSAYSSRNYTESVFAGRYSVSGNWISFELGPSKFVGTIDGNTISGIRHRSDGIRDTWKLTVE